MFLSFIYKLTTARNRMGSDRSEIAGLMQKYGLETYDVIKKRASDQRLSDRDRLHWRRMVIAYTFHHPRLVASARDAELQTL